MDKQSFQENPSAPIDIEADNTMSDSPNATTEEVSTTINDALHEIFRWKNYSVFLLTSWIVSSFMALSYFDILYLRTLHWDVLLIGVVATATSLVATLCRLVGGYFGDVTNRKTLAIVSFFIMGTYYLILGMVVSFELVLIAYLLYSTLNLTKGGSTAFIMDNIPKDHSGLALSLFTMGRTFGIIILLALGMLIPVFGFSQAMRTLYLTAGLLIMAAGTVRATFLTGGETPSRPKDQSLLKNFIMENLGSARILFKTIPIIMLVVTIDAISDAFFRFGALLYTNEDLGVSYEGIIFIILVTLLIQAPLLIITGRFSDKFGVRRASIVLYSLMPLCAILILIAPIFPLWAPQGWYLAAESYLTGLGGVFTTPFLAIFIKTINDTLWWLVLLIIVRRNLPRENTAKFLGIFWVITYSTKSFGPMIAGAIYSFIGPFALFLLVLLLNIVIIGILAKLKQ